MDRVARDRIPRTLTGWRLSNSKSPRLAERVNIGTELGGMDAPKFKFLFTVSFEFGEALSRLNEGSDNMEEIEYACKNVTRPNINVNYVDMNSYNYRFKVATRTDYGSVTLNLYDDNKNLAHRLVSSYLRAISPIANKSAGIDYYLKENIQEWASLGPLPTNEADGLIRTMRVTHHVNSNYDTSDSSIKWVRYDYINPKIQNIVLDELDMSSSEVNTIGLTFIYDSVRITSNITEATASVGELQQF